MADLRISQLNALAGADLASEDLLVAVDDSASETKKLTVGDLIANGVTLIADDTIPGAKILFAAGGIATADLADGAVTTAKLADDGVTAAKLADESTIDLVTTLPASGAFTGQLALDTDDNFLYVWDGSAWVSLKAAGSINTVSGDTSGTINITATTSGSTVTVAATIDDTTVANQFLAGPTGAGGTVAYRVIDSTDLPTSSTTAKGAVLVNGEGLRMDGDTIEVDNDVTDTSTHHVVTYSAKGLITGGRALTSADLPLATSTDAGAVIPGDGLAVDVNGNLSIDNTVATGTYTKVTVTAEGVVSTGDTLDADDIPDHSAAKLTSGTIGSSLIADNAVTAAKLADESTTLFAGASASDDVTTFPDGDFKGQFFYDETGQDLYIYTGTAFVPITVLSGNLVNAGAYNASTNLMSSVTTAGSSAGFSVGAALPAPAGVNLNHYVVVDTSGTGSGAAPAVALAPPDMLLSQGVGTEYQLIDVSNAIAGQTASNISLIATGDITATDVQAGIQELDTEKLPKAGGTMTGDLTLNNVNVVFEGSTADDYETTLTVTDPTADRTITLPNVTGTVVTTGDTGSVTSTMITNGTIVNADINASAEIAVSKLANGTARQLLQTDAAGTGVEFTSNVDVPGTLDVTGAATLDSTASVAGLLSANGKVSFTAGTEALPAIYSGSDTNTGIYSPGADQFGISTAGSARFYIAADGDIGVGTTSPDSPLDCRQDGSGTDTKRVSLNTDVSSISSFTSNDPAVFINNAFAGTGSSGIHMRANAADYSIRTLSTGDLVFEDDATETVRIASNGNLGIGTSSPDRLVHIQKGDAGSAVSDGNTALMIENNSHAIIQMASPNSSSNRILFGDPEDADAGRLTYDHSLNAFLIHVNASEAMRIDSSGNVGIGSSSPGELLELSAANNPKIRFVDEGDYEYKLGIESNNKFSLTRSGSNTQTITVDSGGNVGIGNTDPEALLTLGDFGGSTQLIRFRTGTAQVAGIDFGDDDDADVGRIRYQHSEDSMLFTVNAGERMRINSSGNVGIGTTDIDGQLEVRSSASLGIISRSTSTQGTDTNKALRVRNNSDTDTFSVSYRGQVNIGTAANIQEGSGTDTGATFYNSGILGLSCNNDRSLFLKRLSSNGDVAKFRRDNTGVGSISVTTTSTSYNTSSDHRLKENVVDLDGAIDRVKQLAPRRFNFIADADTTVDGFLAHEAQTVVPEAVTGTHNEVDDDGNAVMQGIDQSKLVPLLTAALKEAIAKIETLETKVAALEAAN